jgi:hypothetical protein
MSGSARRNRAESRRETEILDDKRPEPATLLAPPFDWFTQARRLDW